MIPHGITIFAELSFTETEPVTSRCQPPISIIVVLSRTILKSTFNNDEEFACKVLPL